MKKLEQHIYKIGIYILLIVGWFLYARTGLKLHTQRSFAVVTEQRADSLKTVTDTLTNQRTRLLGYMSEINRWVNSTEIFIQTLQNQVPETLEKVVYVTAPAVQQNTVHTQSQTTAQKEKVLPEPGNDTVAEKFRKFFPTTAWLVDKLNPAKPIQE